MVHVSDFADFVAITYKTAAEHFARNTTGLYFNEIWNLWWSSSRWTLISHFVTLSLHGNTIVSRVMKYIKLNFPYYSTKESLASKISESASKQQSLNACSHKIHISFFIHPYSPFAHCIRWAWLRITFSKMFSKPSKALNLKLSHGLE